MARVSSGKGSKQNYGTPEDFLFGPVQRRFGKVQFDLAAEPKNTKHKRFFAKPHRCKKCGAFAHDSLEQDWASLTRKYGGILWLNPPFKVLAPWMCKCRDEGQKGANVVCLVPAGVGSDWFWKYVFGTADVYFLNGRLSFDDDPYMRDLMIVHFWSGMTGKISIWDWRTDEIRTLLAPSMVVDSTLTYRILAKVLPKVDDEASFVPVKNVDGFRSVGDAFDYLESLKHGDVRQVQGQVIRQELREHVAWEVSS